MLISPQEATSISFRPQLRPVLRCLCDVMLSFGRNETESDFHFLIGRKIKLTFTMGEM
jgi:hypothetical protein